MRSATSRATRSAPISSSDGGRSRASRPSPQTLRTTDRATGVERWTQTKAQAIRGADGEVLYSVTAIEDVTEVRRAEFANRLLARTGELISPSADYLATLKRVPELLVPEFADWCSIEIPGEAGLLDRVAMAHHDPARLEAIYELRERYPLRADEPSRIGDVLRTGESQVIQVTDDWLREIAADADHLRILREIAMGSVLAVPMSAGGHRRRARSCSSTTRARAGSTTTTA